MAELDRIEARLLESRARARAWDELRTRHANVSAIACESAAAHAEGMEKYQRWQVERSRRLEAQLARAIDAKQEIGSKRWARHGALPTAGN